MQRCSGAQVHHRIASHRRQGRHRLQTLGLFTGEGTPRSLSAAAAGVGRASQRRRAPFVPAGIVQGQARVRRVERKPEFCSFEVEFPPGATAGVQTGASVALNGTCLTVVSQDGDVLRFDVIAESLRRTNLGQLREGSPVNFERAARVGDEIGGHTVSGHVHTTARIAGVQRTEDNRRLEFEVEGAEWLKYVLPKGFVAVDGCSLTVGEVTGSSFSAYLIPETLR